MSEGKWNHPMFEQMRNAEVEAPEHVMHAAIKKSNRNGFFYFQWHSFNVWYLTIGLGAMLSLFLFNGQNAQTTDLHSKSEVLSVDKKSGPAPVVQNQMEDKKKNALIQSNTPTLDKKVASRKGSESKSSPVIVGLSETKIKDENQEAATLRANAEISIDSVQVARQDLEREPKSEETLPIKPALTKKGRPLRVKIGENAKP